MVNSKRVMIVGILILLLIFTVQFSFAAKGGDKGGGDNGVLGGPNDIICTIDTVEQCRALEYKYILGLSDYSNAHGDLITEENYENYGDNEGDYDYALCCSYSGPNLPVQSCNDGRKIMGLSSESNAHAEVPQTIPDFYGPLIYEEYDVCYDESSLNCDASSGGVTCGQEVGRSEIISLSSDGNAHIGIPGIYDTQICCDVEFIMGPFCGDGLLDEDNEQCDMGTSGVGNCLIEPLHQCECFYGYVENPINNGCYFEAAGAVHWSGDEDGSLQLLTKDVIIGSTTVYLVVLDNFGNEGTSVDFEIFENDIFNDDYVTTVSADFTSGKAISNWTVSLEDIENAQQGGGENVFEFYFKAIYEDYETSDSTYLDATITASPLCETKSRCMDYINQASCESDSYTCQLAENSLENIDCSNIDCYCEWDVEGNVCAPGWSSETDFCSYEEDTTDTCEDMLLTYSWEATWSVEGESNDLCVDGESTVPCPAQIQLGFFSFYNLIIIIVLIILIYTWMNAKKQVKRRKK